MLDQFIQYLTNLDLFYFYFFNIQLKNSLFDFLMPIITYGGAQITWLIFCGLFYLWGDQKAKRVAFLILVALVIGYFFSEAIKLLFARPRPGDILDIGFFMEETGYSFPSGHSIASFSAFSILGVKYGYIYLFIFLALMVAISRIYLGVHYPSDVLVGSALGIIFALTVLRMEGKLISLKNKVFNQYLKQFFK